MIQLEVGKSFSLPLDRIRVDLSWNPRPSQVPADNFDLDASAFMLDENSKLIRDEFFVFYNNLSSPDEAVKLKGDDIDGSDGESIYVSLNYVDPKVKSILLLVTIYHAQDREQSFDHIEDASIELFDRRNGTCRARFDLSATDPGATALEFGRFIRTPDGWEFEPIGKGYPRDLAYYVEKFSRNE